MINRIFTAVYCIYDFREAIDCGFHVGRALAFNAQNAERWTVDSFTPASVTFMFTRTL